MTLLKEELTIINLQELLRLNLALPLYQRPYRWSVQSANALFLDNFESYQQGLREYRVGSVILHKENQTYNVVDGQQRLTTISILLHSLGRFISGLLTQYYSEASYQAIIANQQLFKKSVSELSESEKQGYNYLLTYCTAVKVVTDDEQEAFQFFDSQNSRGKTLDPHDLLKSYHLREMQDEVDAAYTVKLIGRWENVPEVELRTLFNTYLYPITQWVKGRDGLGYNVNKIGIFKGIKSEQTYNYAIYHKASHIFTEQFNNNGNHELIASKALNQFQLIHPVVSGKRFFHYVMHYHKQLHDVRLLIRKYHSSSEDDIKTILPDQRSGDTYIKQLYESILLFYADRFGMEALTPAVLQVCYSWCYSFRLTMENVTLLGINRYARGLHDRLNLELDLFVRIGEMNEAHDIKLVILEEPDIANQYKKKYEAIYNQLKEWNRW
ncbi:DUF262 domain-containing protein [Paenibacillus yanchengensis]|uniref:DUF262 domain-containing protein n=1 Tax=Paenibacillus yanchengensis TaxID=2035833 RepID=A0ABW4YMF5_9BACL